MLARLQQVITITWILAIAGWLGVWIPAGRPGWAVSGAVVLLGGHAFVLAAEFLVMSIVNRRDPAPAAQGRQLLAAWWGEAIAAPRVFCWRQPFRARAVPDHVVPVSRRGVVFIHGFVCNRGLWNSWMRRLRERGIPFAAVNLEPVFGSIDDYIPIIDRAVREVTAVSGAPPIVVAHSMGGLALRRWWTEPGNDPRILHAITIGTPHAGTWLARLAMTPNGRQMRRGSDWLRRLHASEPADRAARITCFYGNCDHIVFPASTACYPRAKAFHLPGVAHVRMADHPAPWAELNARLQG